MGFFKKSGRRIVEILAWRFSKNQADLQNTGALQKNRRTIEYWRALKSPRLVKNQRDWKNWRPAYCLGSAESPAADFLVDWLKSSRSDPRRFVASLSCRPQVRRRLRLPCFYGGSLSRTVPQIFTNSCEISKILTQLLSVLSLSRKFVCDHCCCPISATILMTSKLEAILYF